MPCGERPRDAGLGYSDSMEVDSSQVFPESGPSAAGAPPARRLGVAGLALGIVAIGLEVLAISIGSGGAWAAATMMAWLALGLFVVAFAFGIVAILTGRGRRWGIAASALSLAANPLVLVGIFRALAGTG